MTSPPTNKKQKENKELRKLAQHAVEQQRKMPRNKSELQV